MHVGVYGEIITEVIFGFFGLFLLTKILGKTQMNQITPFDFIAAIAAGELFGNALFDPDAGIPQIAVAIITWGILMFVIEKLTQRFKRTRGFFEGKPSVIISQGEIQYNDMKVNKMDFNQLMHQLRANNVFSLSEVDYAIIEADGSLSILKKSAYQTPTRDDLKLKEQPNPLPISFILDGEIIEDNVINSGKTLDWLSQEVKKQGFDTVADVAYAEWTPTNGLFTGAYH
ncbi:Uncharacterized membrane protein YcaP, DUF421 family [Terribacillus saccharophilus]|uniref:Uncharacterized membrane protein YcaP, DUF421 family n=1 Tax=Terribacillus saccharophilus TaxID=361277 RepID=A0AAX2EDX1_9BACI|nr:Uncharacterized membrane protein YcaP, DUF421 family [Terribacillus saccharophilus]